MWPFPKRLKVPDGMLVPSPGGRVAAGDRLENLAAGLNTPRDKRFHNRFTISPQANRNELEAMYDDSWLAGRIVSTVAHDMLRAGWSISWKDSAKDQASVQAVNDAAESYQLLENVLEGLLWGRLYGGAGSIPFLRGERLEDLAKPLDMSKIWKGDLLNYVTRDRWWIAPTGQPDPTPGPNFGLPSAYMLSDAGTVASTTIHWTRLVRWNGRKLPRISWFRNGMWDGSVLQPCIDSVKDYDATKAGIASMVWEANVDIMKATGLADLLSTTEGTNKAISRFQAGAMMKSFNRMVLIDKEEEEFDQKQINFGGLKDILMDLMIDVCGAADMPMTRLFGQSAAGLTATGEFDLKNYHEHIRAQQKNVLRPSLIRVYEPIVRSTLGRWPDEFAIEFNPLQDLTDKERSETQLNDAKRDQIYLREGVITEGTAARRLQEDKIYNLTDAEVRQAEQLAKQLAAMPAANGNAAPGGGGASGAERPGAPAPSGAKKTA